MFFFSFSFKIIIFQLVLSKFFRIGAKKFAIFPGKCSLKSYFLAKFQSEYYLIFNSHINDIISFIFALSELGLIRKVLFTFLFDLLSILDSFKLPLQIPLSFANVQILKPCMKRRIFLMKIWKRIRLL